MNIVLSPSGGGIIRSSKFSTFVNTKPNTPTVSVTSHSATDVVLAATAFSDPDSSQSIAASQWQIAPTADTTFATPTADETDTLTDGQTHTFTGLSASTTYRVRVRHKDNSGDGTTNWSDWSSAVTFTSDSSGFQTPDKLNNISFESDFTPFTSWNFSSAPTGVTRDNTQSAAGSYSVKRSWTSGAGETGSQFAYQFGNYDRIWFKWSFRLTTPITSIMKTARFYNSSGSEGFGGLFIGSGTSILMWGWDQEADGIATRLGGVEASVADSTWHTFEFDYWRNGDPSGFPSVAFWLDGSALHAEVNGHSTIQYYGSGNLGYWDTAGRLQAGQRLSSSKLNWMEALATLNAGNSTTGQMNVDKIYLSTLGRIGP